MGQLPACAQGAEVPALQQLDWDVGESFPLWASAACWWSLGGPGYPWGGDSISTCALQNQLLTKGMVILRDKIRFYEGESGGPLPGPGARPRCSGVWPLGTVALRGLHLGLWVGGVALLVERVQRGRSNASRAAGLRSDPGRGPCWEEHLPPILLGPRRAEGCLGEGPCFTSLPTRASGPREPRPSAWEDPHQDL